MRRTIGAALVAIVGWLTYPIEALACSVVGNYMPPSDFEIVGMADAIVVATAVGGVNNDDDPREGTVHFRIEQVLKGKPPAEFDSDGFGLIERPSDDLPEFYGGACGRVAFTKGKTYTLLLSSFDDPDRWQELPYLFTPTSSDYEGVADEWVARIKTYLDIQKRFSPMEQLAELERILAKLQSAPRSDQRDAEIERLTEHLYARSPYKPTQYLTESYEQIESGAKLRRPILEPYYGQPEGPKELPVDQQKERVLLSLIDGGHEDASPLFERLLAKPDISAIELASAVKFVASVQKNYVRAIDLIETRIASQIDRLPALDAVRLISAASSAMRDDGIEPAWQSEPEVAKRWPHIAFGFAMYSEARFGEGFSYFAEMEALAPSDYRIWPDWTLLEARNYNDELEAWAISELRNDRLRTDHEAAISRISPDSFDKPLQDPARLPMRALVRSNADDRDKVLREMFCKGPTRRLLLISALGSDSNPDDYGDDDLFAEMLASSSLAEGDRTAIIVALAEITGRDHAYAKAMGFDIPATENRWTKLIKTAAIGEKANVKGIACTSG